MTPAPPVPEQAVTLALADGEMHELVFTDREARPAKWETRCRRTDVPLERAGSAGPGMHYPVTCGACLRIAGLEAALKRFEHLEESAVAAAVRRGLEQAVAGERKRWTDLLGRPDLCLEPCDLDCESGPNHCEWLHQPNHKPGWHSPENCPLADLIEEKPCTT